MTNQFALILWISENKTAIVPDKAVTDKRMLTEPEMVGKVKWMGEGDRNKAEPKDGWKQYDARALAVSADGC